MPTFKIDEAERARLEAISNAVPVAAYDSSKEVRNKGVGFYQFSLDYEKRQQQLHEFRQTRQDTLREREAVQIALEKRRKQLDERRQLIRQKRDALLAKAGENWLNDMQFTV